NAIKGNSISSRSQISEFTYTPFWTINQDSNLYGQSLFYDVAVNMNSKAPPEAKKQGELTTSGLS
ncbi:MAG: hypothetical protein VX276_05620, partial [Pseudomonadota bacterium]|nr:hypothetical protein [Pseudomonadota bacterium]